LDVGGVGLRNGKFSRVVLATVLSNLKSSAAERYADITQDERQRRRERGWGNDDPALVTAVRYHFSPFGSAKLSAGGHAAVVRAAASRNATTHGIASHTDQ